MLMDIELWWKELYILINMHYALIPAVYANGETQKQYL